MSKYFTKFLPVEGEIKEGDKFLDHTDNLIKDAHIPEIYNNPHVPYFDGYKKVKLFLCSRDIQIGDKVKSFNYPEQYEGELVNLRTSKKLVGAKDHSEIYHLADIQYPNDSHCITAAISNFFKVIGEILTPGIVENQEFTEDEVKSLTITKDDEFTYPGYMSTEAQEFFKGHYVEEQRDGCGAVGTFLKLSDGKTKMPSKGDIFIRNKKGISLKTKES